MARRKHAPAYRRSYYPANDNYRWKPRVVPYAPRPVVNPAGRFPFRALALALALGQMGRSRYLGHPATRSVLAQEDRRRWHPAGALAPAGALSRSARGLVLAGSEGSGLGSAVRFRSPVKVSICVRRKVRREVIMAKGKGGGGHRPPTRNYWSDVQC